MYAGPGERGRPEIALEPYQIDCMPDPENEDVRDEGLFDEIHGAESQSMCLGILTVICCQEDDRDFFRRIHLFLQSSHRLKSVKSRHLDIQKNQIRFVCLDIIKQCHA